jgi:hypothetical protein
MTDSQVTEGHVNPSSENAQPQWTEHLKPAEQPAEQPAPTVPPETEVTKQ